MMIGMLRLTGDMARIKALMGAHNDWIARGFEEGVFLLTGGLKPGPGGAVIAHGLDRAAFQARLAEDPFVAQGLAEVEVIEIAPGRTEPRLDFLAG